MKIDKAGRDTLKGYFVKNAVPTASNFEDLVNAGLNQREDGIAKLPGEPLSLQADGDDVSQKKLLNLYRNFTDLAPAWSLALNPRANPADPATAKAGFSVSDATGVSRLFIDQTTGKLGVGMVAPAMTLDVAGVARLSASHNANRDADSRLSYGGNLVLKGNAPQIDFLDTDHNEWAIHVNANKMYFIREPWTFTDLVLDGAGNIGMGTDTPRAKLEVRGGAIMPTIGDSAAAGITFPQPAGDGGGDSAWLRYFPRNGVEACTLELGISNDSEDHIALMASGNVGVGRRDPEFKLDVVGGIRALGNTKDPESKLNGAGTLTLKGTSPQLDFIDTDHTDWAIHVNSNKMYFIREPWNYTDLVLDGAGRIGMGTDSPQATLDVRGPIYAGDSHLYFTKTDHNHSGIGNTAGWAAIENTANYNCLMVLGRSTGTPAGRVVGVWDTLNVAGTLNVGGRMIATSDRDAKRDIAPLTLGLKEVLRLQPVSFNWKALDNPKKSIGLIAQDVQAVIDELVHDTHIGDNQHLGIAYDGLIPVLINAVKELAERLQALEPKLAV